MNEFMEILVPVAELLKRKNTDYGNSYDETRREFGPASFLLRINDKFTRLKNLTSNEAQVNDESVEDTISDIIGYCTLELRYRRWKNQNEKTRDKT
ncbi:MAG: nucleotide modification associated domain-containing protein [Desulfosporosinus sp.]|nr:nucleotide modification associated domain-containing protein [Desulfosporosinus sp.]